MKAKIKSKEIIAKDTLETQYDLLGQKAIFLAGQFFFITLPGGLRHHFTIVNSPNDGEILSNATRLRDTEFKNKLQALPVGTEVEVGQIAGDFALPEIILEPLVFIALGIGVTPFVSMLRYIKEKNKDYKVTLIYSDSDRESMAYLSELEAYAKENSNFKLILTITRDESWAGERRHVDDNFIKDYLKNFKENLYFVSGPPKAVEAVTGALEKAGVEKGNITTENFFGY